VIWLALFPVLATVSLLQAEPAPGPGKSALDVVLSVDDLTFSEADGGSLTADFPVHLSAASDQIVSFSYETFDATATSGEDYVASSGSLQIPVGETSAVISVSILDDSLDETDESFTVLLTNIVGASAGDTEASCTILDNDADTSLNLNEETTTPTPGEDIEFDIVVLNNGHHVIATSNISDLAPPQLSNLRWNCLPSPGAFCAMGFQQGPLNDMPRIPPGGSVSYVLLGTVDPAATGSFSYNVEYDLSSSGLIDSNPDDNSASSELVAQPKTDLGLNITESDDPLPEDGQLSYTLSATNHGPSTSTGGQIVDQLPPEFEFESSPDGCSLTLDGVVCPFGRLDPGQSVSVSFTVSGTPTQGLLVENSATIQPNEFDPNAANDQDQEEISLDGTPPFVRETLSLPEGAMLGSCTEITEGVQSIRVDFSEPMSNPAGDDTVGDLSNPESYLLLEAGPNGDFESEYCGSPSGDDVEIPISSVSTLSDRATLELSGASLRNDGLYRLIVCSSLQDPAKNFLDGNQDGQGGDSLSLTFRLSSSNLFSNGHFDCSLDGFEGESTIPEEIEFSSVDALNSGISGSAHLQTINTISGQSLGLSQCLPIDSGSVISLSGSARISSPSGEPVEVESQCAFFPQPNCNYEALRVDSGFQDLSDTNASFYGLASFSSQPAPDGSQSVRCGVYLSSPTGEDFEAWIDNLEATAQLSSALFSDGFEDGSLSAWSGVVID